MILGINESKRLTKHIPCNFRCKTDGSNLSQKWNNDKSRCEYKNSIKYDFV